MKSIDLKVKITDITPVSRPFKKGAKIRDHEGNEVKIVPGTKRYLHEPKKKAEPKCEVATEFCSGEGVTRFTGTKPTDPKFYCCLACFEMLRRRGLKLKQL